MPGRRGRAAGASQPFAKKKRAVLPPRKDWNFCDIGATNVKETRLGRAIKRGWASQYSLGEPVLRGRWASQHRSTLGELASNRAGRASIEDWASIKHGCSYWRLLSAAPLAQWTRASATCSVAPNLAPPHLTRASATCSVAPNLAPPHLLSGRRRLPLAQWHQISHRPTCSVDAGVCHLLSGTKFAPAPLVQWMLASPTCSVAPSRPPHELTAALPGRSASRRQLVFFFTLVNVCVS